MVCAECVFETERLRVGEWHFATHRRWSPADDLAEIVLSLMTEEVTRSLPLSWQGAYTHRRASEWIQERDDEGTTLLVLEKRSHAYVGLVVLFEEPAPYGSVDIRIGYLLHQSVWGKGMASELLQGLVAWCREATRIRALVGGVAPDNLASRKVLTKNGFHLVPEDRERPESEHIYELVL